MKTTQFRRELKILIYYIREYGIRHIDFTIDINDLDLDIEKANEFYKQVHKGFYSAQENVVLFLNKILHKQKKLKTELAKARAQKQKTQIEEIDKLLHKAKYQELILRKVMDAIAWQLFHYDLSTMRRLYYGQRPIDITDSNLSSELSYIDYFSRTEPNGFVLISDLTSFIQIGDIVTLSPGKGISISELKEGEVNARVLELIDDVVKFQCPHYLKLRLDNEDEKFAEQFFRNVKQTQKRMQVSETIKTGSGTDLMTGQKIQIIQDEIELDTYTEVVYGLLKDCDKKGYAISVIEGCLLIGVYQTDKFPSQAFDYWAKGLQISMPIIDIRQTFSDPLAYPIFLQPFSDNLILDIVFGKKVIKMTLDINQWLETFKKEGCAIRWLNKKEIARFNSKLKGKMRIFDIDGCGVEIEKDGVKQTLVGGLFSRMFTSFNTPSSLKKYIVTGLEKAKEFEDF